MRTGNSQRASRATLSAAARVPFQFPRRFGWSADGPAAAGRAAHTRKPAAAFGRAPAARAAARTPTSPPPPPTRGEKSGVGGDRARRLPGTRRSSPRIPRAGAPRTAKRHRCGRAAADRAAWLWPASVTRARGEGGGRVRVRAAAPRRAQVPAVPSVVCAKCRPYTECRVIGTKSRPSQAPSAMALPRFPGARAAAQKRAGRRKSPGRPDRRAAAEPGTLRAATARLPRRVGPVRRHGCAPPRAPRRAPPAGRTHSRPTQLDSTHSA